MLQLKLIVGKGKLVSTEGIGLVRVDPRFSRSPYSRSARCRGQGAGEPEQFKKERNWERLEPNFVWSGSERAHEVRQAWAGDWWCCPRPHAGTGLALGIKSYRVFSWAF